MAKVPIELLDAFASMTPGTMSREEAFRIREELMKERSVDLEFGNGMFTHVSGQWLGEADCVLISRGFFTRNSTCGMCGLFPDSTRY